MWVFERQGVGGDQTSRMKINNLCRALCVAGSVWAVSLGTQADEASPTAQAQAKSKTYSGIITTEDAKDRTLTVQGMVFHKTFQVGESCRIRNPDGKSADLGDLRPGQRVNVNYRDAHGVLVAEGIARERMIYTGSVEAIDPEKHSIKVKGRILGRTFALPPDCRVILKDDRNGGLNDIKVGHTITVVYETPHGAPTARRLEQTSATFVGSLDAIDASTRMVKVKQLVGEKKFSLAEDCRIVVNGKSNASMNDLRLGQRLAFSYDEVDGVNVVTRIGPATEPANGETALSSKAAERGGK